MTDTENERPAYMDAFALAKRLEREYGRIPKGSVAEADVKEARRRLGVAEASLHEARQTIEKQRGELKVANRNVYELTGQLQATAATLGLPDPLAENPNDEHPTPFEQARADLSARLVRYTLAVSGESAAVLVQISQLQDDLSEARQALADVAEELGLDTEDVRLSEILDDVRELNLELARVKKDRATAVEKLRQRDAIAVDNHRQSNERFDALQARHAQDRQALQRRYDEARQDLQERLDLAQEERDTLARELAELKVPTSEKSASDPLDDMVSTLPPEVQGIARALAKRIFPRE